ncbi:hypothetical protein KCP73_18560 [Salmonella enterica subsp. enterica]|nr:hypothetical protein KCP73_18560 [Salmonella enterica subsp. enterica]
MLGCCPSVTLCLLVDDAHPVGRTRDLFGVLLRKARCARYSSQRRNGSGMMWW